LVMAKSKVVKLELVKASNLEATQVKLVNKVVLTKTGLIKAKKFNKVVVDFKTKVTLRAQVAPR